MTEVADDRRKVVAAPTARRPARAPHTEGAPVRGIDARIVKDDGSIAAYRIESRRGPAGEGAESVFRGYPDDEATKSSRSTRTAGSATADLVSPRRRHVPSNSRAA